MNVQGRRRGQAQPTVRDPGRALAVRLTRGPTARTVVKAPKHGPVTDSPLDARVLGRPTPVATAATLS